jgi:hypothetical protein
MKIKFLNWILILKKTGLNKREELSPAYFPLLIEEVVYTYSQFRFNRLGHKKINGKIYQNLEDKDKNFKTIWDLILVSFLICYILGLAKIFDEKHYWGKNTFCIYHFVDKSRFKEKNGIIDKIITARNEIVAHLDAEARKEPAEDGLLAKYGLTPENIDSLFEDIFNSINEVKGRYNYLSTLGKSINDNEIDKEFDKWFGIFEKTYGENVENKQNTSNNTDNNLINGLKVSANGSAHIIEQSGSPRAIRFSP